MPKQWILISCYMVFIFCVGIAAVQWVKRHPIVDDHGQQAAAPALPQD